MNKILLIDDEEAIVRLLSMSLRADGYDGVISFESVYHPGNGNFEDGFRQCIGVFKEHFA